MPMRLSWQKIDMRVSLIKPKLLTTLQSLKFLSLCGLFPLDGVFPVRFVERVVDLNVDDHLLLGGVAPSQQRLLGGLVTLRLTTTCHDRLILHL